MKTTILQKSIGFIIHTPTNKTQDSPFPYKLYSLQIHSLQKKSSHGSFKTWDVIDGGIEVLIFI